MTMINCNEVTTIKKIILKHPENAYIDVETVQSQWKKLNYTSCPGFAEGISEYNYFVKLLRKFIPEIHFLPKNNNTSIDSIYVRDSIIVTPKGIILCNMGKKQRKTEPGEMGKFILELQLPVIGEIDGKGKIEGGDIVWFDNETVAIGLGYRTNKNGIKQFKKMTKDIIKELIIVPLPHWNGPDDVLHLMSFISPIDHKLAAVYSRIMPVTFRNWLIKRGVKLIEIPEDEYDTMACNILTIAPKKCIMLEGNPKTKKLLENHDIEVITYKGDEISRKGAGGPTCLTRPIFRNVE